MTNRSPKKKVSAVIPTLNGAGLLPDFFRVLKKQTLVPDEILVADSCSDDNSVDICREGGAEVIEIARKDFDHGGTRTKLAMMTEGEIIVFFTQDAILATDNAIENLVRPLLEEDDIGCSYGRQLPQSNSTEIAAHLRLFNYPPQSLIRTYQDREKYGLKTIFISNSFSAYKKEVLASVNYFKDGLIFGEDTCTLGRILEKSYRVAYVGDAAVYHSHNYSLREEFRRSFDIGVLHSSEQWLLDVYGNAEGVGGRYASSLISALLRGGKYLHIPDALLRLGSKFIGYKLGKTYMNLPTKLVPYLSLNRMWWNT